MRREWVWVVGCGFVVVVVGSRKICHIEATTGSYTYQEKATNSTL